MRSLAIEFFLGHICRAIFFQGLTVVLPLLPFIRGPRHIEDMYSLY